MNAYRDFTPAIRLGVTSAGSAGTQEEPVPRNASGRGRRSTAGRGLSRSARQRTRISWLSTRAGSVSHSSASEQQTRGSRRQHESRRALAPRLCWRSETGYAVTSQVLETSIRNSTESRANEVAGGGIRTHKGVSPVTCEITAFTNFRHTSIVGCEPWQSRRTRRETTQALPLASEGCRWIVD